MPVKTTGDVMHEYKERSLHSGKGGKVVTKRKQAIAIMLSMLKSGKVHKGK